MVPNLTRWELRLILPYTKRDDFETLSRLIGRQAMGRIRNVRIWTVSSDGSQKQEVAGFWQHGTITVSKFLAWLGLCIVVHDDRNEDESIAMDTSEWGLYPSGEEGLLSEEPLQATLLLSGPGEAMPVGDYLILNRRNLKPLRATQTTYQYYDRSSTLRRLGDLSAEAATSVFTRRVRERDGACCITGRTKEGCGDDWEAFAAVHIFPPEYLSMWISEGVGGMIQDDGPDQGPDHIDSVQNGLLLQWTEAVHWELHNITVDIEDGTIIDFTQSGAYAGRQLRLNRNVEEKYGPLNALLQSHYLQAVLANLRGPGKGLPAGCNSETPQERRREGVAV